MKKIITVALLIVGMTSFAQERKMKSEKAEMEQLTPEQRNQLHLKKMTLELDLNAEQQKEMSKIIAEQNTKREAAMAERKANEEAKQKITSDERFARQNKMLDEQIALKERVKKILNPEQFKKWDEMRKHKHDGMKKRMIQKGRKKSELEDK